VQTWIHTHIRTHKNKFKNEPVRWCTPVISALGRLKQEDLEFEGSLDYIANPVSKKAGGKKRKKLENKKIEPKAIRWKKIKIRAEINELKIEKQWRESISH
jgi:hypothetical protein